MSDIKKLIEKYVAREEETCIAAKNKKSAYVSGKHSVYIEVIRDLKDIVNQLKKEAV